MTPVLGPAVPLDRMHMEVFELLQTQGRPLTVRRIAQLMKSPETEVQSALGALLELRLIGRLNTIIVSYVAKSPGADRGLDKGLRAGDAAGAYPVGARRLNRDRSVMGT
ncbi:MAG: hypothetical protein JW990_03420 [Thermoleophilia bacterium]|nr:hypothetical protein [Thermoleophilia bacterium]